MQFSIEKEIFFKSLSKIQGIVEKKNTIPILSNVLIETKNNEISIIGTDLEVGMKSLYPATVIKPGRITVSAKKIFEIIKELPETSVLFTAKENSWIEIKCGKSTFNIVGLSPDEFPNFNDSYKNDDLIIKSSILKNMIDKTFFSISTDETKYNLNGIFFKSNIENGLSLIATDGHRLSLITHKIDCGQSKELERGVIFPKKGIFELKKLAEEDESEILIGFYENNAVINKKNNTLIMRLVDGEFPDYKRVIPLNNNLRIILNKDTFIHALKRVSILSNEKSKGVKLNLKDNFLEISSSNTEFGDAKEEMEIIYKGPEISIGYNARFIIDVLQNQDSSNIELLIKDSISPGIIKSVGDENYLAVIMPMRL